VFGKMEPTFNASFFPFHRVDLETKTLNKIDKKEKFVRRLTILLDLGGIITDKRQRTKQWHYLIGDYFALLFGRTAQEWNTAHQIVTERLLDQGEALQQATPDFITFHHTYDRYWLSGMCELLGLPIPAEEECIALVDQAIASISSRIQAALKGCSRSHSDLALPGISVAYSFWNSLL
jgi:hypothetical protein